MKYDFENISPRFGIGSKKWQEMKGNPLVTDDVIPFSVADMELKTAPEITEGLKNFIDNNILGYAGSNKKYRQSVINWMKKHHGWDVQADWLIETHSVVNAFFTAVKAFTQKGDGIMLFTPVYYPMYKAIEVNERRLVEVPLINNGISYDIDWDKFAAAAAAPGTKMLILCSPHNPCGRIWTKDELSRLSEICLAHNVFVVSDEIHADLIMPGFKHTCYATVSEAARSKCIICTAPSKTFNLAGMQLSNIFIPNEKYRKLFQAEQATDADFACSILSYEACRLAYTHGEDWLAQVIDLISTNKQLITDFMQEYFPQVKITELQATYLLWLDFRSFNLPPAELERINREKACLYFDEGYIFGKAGEGFERWNLACPTKYIQAALNRLYETYKKFAVK
ncbi:MalY/PatB family protein [Megamonas hypermegale]|uniref:cysteine-S-conjugate beta-lyase n=1 Tax=Megamonas hypermegale TaxID=158847 RepID=A0A921HPU2_9FIRM|nr:MalY/PatB family protein [Megamonas hypermegale]MDM8144172.1 MalY/PatB family protein [Megamonas hypermegale]HJF85731.1 pyridoxal phosphate-dependent aminotransferase [Megamonas hypermegale]